MLVRRLADLARPKERLLFFWRDSWSDHRNRLLGSSRFQRWAARFLPTRRLARRHAQALFDLCAGFVYSQVLLACVQLGLLEWLAAGPQDLPAIAERLGLTQERTVRLLGAAEALELVEKRAADRYGLGPLGAVVAGNPGIMAMIRHHPMLYQDLVNPVELLRSDETPRRLAAFWSYAGESSAAALRDEQVGAYSELMAASQTLIAEQVLSSYSLRNHRCLLDVGGGSGAFLSAAAQWPHLQLKLFDLPAVVAQARPRLQAAGIVDRVEQVGGDFFRDPLPSGADVISLIRVVHDHDDDPALRLLRAVHQSLPDGGVLLLAEPMAGSRAADRVADAYFGFYLMAMGSGRARSPEQLGELLRQAGFKRHRLCANTMPMQTRVMVAYR